jgi:hypothetical protein
MWPYCKRIRAHGHLHWCLFQAGELNLGLRKKKDTLTIRKMGSGKSP